MHPTLPNYGLSGRSSADTEVSSDAAIPHFCAETVDDLMRYSIKAILAHGVDITATKGPNRELMGVVLKLTNPRARLSRTETRGKLFSALGELCWYLDGSDQLDFIEYYIPKYSEFADNLGKLPGAYGPRLFCWNNMNQFSNVTRLLRRKEHSRQAVIQLFSRQDIVSDYKDVTCTCTLHFLVRSGQLDLIVHMRSNDVFIGLSHDIFCFTMLQEIMTRALDVKLGSYIHMVGSLHLYDENREAAQGFLQEGWQSTSLCMPTMPRGDPWPDIDKLVLAEREIRNGDTEGISRLENCESYWKDLGRLLLVFRYFKRKKYDRVRDVRGRFCTDYYRSFIDHRLRI